MRRILVLRGGALGDLIVTLPALDQLRRRWPAAHIALVGNPRAAALARDARLIDVVQPQSAARWAALYQPPPLPAELAAELRAFDLVLNFWPDPDGDLHRHFPLHAAQRFLSAPAQPSRAPAAAHYCAALAPLGLPAPAEYRFALGAPAPGARGIAIHPGSGSPRKNWPLKRWEQVCAALGDAPGTELLTVTGEAEPAGLLARYGRPAHDLPWPALIAELQRCRLFLGHDSGVSHLAAAAGVPCVLLFGPTDPAVWAPPGAHVAVLRRGPAVSDIAVADMLAALAQHAAVS